MCVSSSWDLWKTPEISFSLTVVPIPTLQLVFMYLNRGGSRILGNGGPISVNSSYLLGDLPSPQNPKSFPKNTQNTQQIENASNFPLRALSLELTLGPISEGGTRIEGVNRARTDGEAQEKAEEPLARKILRIQTVNCAIWCIFGGSFNHVNPKSQDDIFDRLRDTYSSLGLHA